MRRTRTIALLTMLGALAPATAHAQATTQFFPASVPVGTPDTPLPEARQAAISDSGIEVIGRRRADHQRLGRVDGAARVSRPSTPTAARAQPVSDGEFPNIVGPPANIYSLVATIVAPGDNCYLTGSATSGSSSATANSITATRSAAAVRHQRRAVPPLLGPRLRGQQRRVLHHLRRQRLDLDGIPNATDNCGTVPNPGQLNTDGDAQGDACDADDDNDTVPDAADNCSVVANPDQVNTDTDPLGDACDADDDNDTVARRSRQLPARAQRRPERPRRRRPG